MAFSAPSLKSRALRLLSQREHSRTEALDELMAKDFINETRVVQSVVNQRAARMGAARVRQELQHKGIAPEAIAEAVAGLKDTELERARGVWQRRFDALPADAKERARQGRFLLARGFSGAVVARVLRCERDG